MYHDHNLYCSLSASSTITSQIRPFDGYILIILGLGLFLIPTSLLCLCLKIVAESISFNSHEGFVALREGRIEWAKKCVAQNSLTKNIIKTRITDVEIHESVLRMQNSNKRIYKCSVQKKSSERNGRNNGKVCRQNRVCRLLFNNKCLCDNDNRKRSCFGSGLCWVICCCRESSSSFKKSREESRRRESTTWTTPLHVAAIYGHLETVKLLLKHGARPDDVDGEGRAVIWYVDQLVSGKVKTQSVVVTEISSASYARNLRSSQYGNVYECLLMHEARIAQNSTSTNGIELRNIADSMMKRTGLKKERKSSKTRIMMLMPHVWSFGESVTGMLGNGERVSKSRSARVIEKISGVSWGRYIMKEKKKGSNARDIATSMLSNSLGSTNLEVLTLGTSYSHVVLGVSYSASTKTAKDMVDGGVYTWGTGGRDYRLAHSSKSTFIPTLIPGSQNTQGHTKSGENNIWRGPEASFNTRRTEHNNEYLTTVATDAGSAHSMALVLKYRKTKYVKSKSRVEEEDNEMKNSTDQNMKPFSSREVIMRDSTKGQGWTYDRHSNCDYQMHVVSWGRNDGRLGTGPHNGMYHSAPQIINPRLFYLRRSRSYENNIKGEIISIACGTWHSACLDSEGNLYMFGSNASGRCGVGDETIKTRMLSVPSIVRFSHRVIVQQVSCGDSHTIAIAISTGNGSRSSQRNVYSWGNGRYGRLGHGDETTVKSPRLIKWFEKYGDHVTGVSAGGNFSVVLIDTENTKKNISNRDQNVLFAFGNGSDGQLGCGDYTQRLLPSRVHNRDQVQNQRLRFKYVSAGQKHCLAVVETSDKRSHDIYAWGNNSAGQLGLEDCLNRKYPTLVKTFMNRDIAVDRGQIILKGLFPNIFTYDPNRYVEYLDKISNLCK